MRRLLAGSTSLALVLALGASVRADDTNAANRNPNEAQTIHGVISGVTVEGETVIDHQTNRAIAAQMTYITVVGSPIRDNEGRSRAARGDNDRDRNRDNAREARNEGDRGAGRRRHNVYVLWLSPRTKVRDASHGDRQNAADTSWENLEIGDRVEVTFAGREINTNANPNANNAQRQKHGRHRTYFGDANTITILAEPGRRDRDSDRNANPNASDRNVNPNQNQNRDPNKR